MSRTNIFELIKKNNSMDKDTTRLDTLFSGTKFFELDFEYYSRVYFYTLKEFVDKYCFHGWTHRNRCLNVEDYLSTLDYAEMQKRADNDSLDDFLSIIEIIYNFFYLAVKYCSDHKDLHIVCSTLGGDRFTADILKEMMDDCLSEYNQKAYYFPEEEKCLISEDSPQVTAAAEASEPSIALEIVRYNHRQMKGDIEQKKAVIKVLFDHLEGRKREITDIDKSLYDCISSGLNNLNIRHNNVNPANKATYKKAVAEMPAEELEKHYDNLYQLILLAILEMDNVQRQRDMKELIKRVCE